MTGAEVVALLTFLDGFFALGGKLIDKALEKAPELNVARPFPGSLTEVADARAAADKRIEGDAAIERLKAATAATERATAELREAQHLAAVATASPAPPLPPKVAP